MKKKKIFNVLILKYHSLIKRRNIIYGILINFFYSFITLFYTSFLLNLSFLDNNLFFLKVFTVIFLSRQITSFLFFDDFKLSWSKASIWTAYIKFFNNTISLIIYFAIFHFLNYKIPINLLLFEYSNFLFVIAISIYTYRYYKTGSLINSKNNLIIYGAGKAGLSVKSELNKSNLIFFIDDDKKMHYRSIDGVSIISSKKALNHLYSNIDNKDNTSLIIAMPSTNKDRIIKIYNRFFSFVGDVKILPPSSMNYQDKPYVEQLKKISIIDLLARNPKDLDKKNILNFIQNKVVLITGSSGTIGSELLKLCIENNAKKIIAIDHNEFSQYNLLEKNYKNVIVHVVSVLNKSIIEGVFKDNKPDIVIHAAAYKHVHLSEFSPSSAIENNIIGTKNIVDISVNYNVKKFVLISTDKAVRPTNIMGATKSIAELYCQNIKSEYTDVISVRFGNVLNSSGSVIPKFQNQIDNDLDITVTHKDITRYFMLVSEAANLVLQAASIGKNGEILILDMGDPIKISDLAQKMISLSGKDLKIKYTGLRKGEKLYEELLFEDSDKKTKYNSITIAFKRNYDFEKLNLDIYKLINSEKNDQIKIIKKILPDFEHLRDNNSTLSKSELKKIGLIN